MVVVYYFSAAHYVALTWTIRLGGKQKKKSFDDILRWDSGTEFVEMKHTNAVGNEKIIIFIFLKTAVSKVWKTSTLLMYRFLLKKKSK